ncbi:MAG: hypothetical protein IT552_08400 [Sphingomonadaceae bacterium]|nr:hypothetical protein [Sphingomonadaceae bacterium]
MAFGKKANGKGFGPAAQRAFLSHLAQTSNVSASAKTAGVTTFPVYDLRRKSPDFCTKWLAALSEGYARLEANLLSEALSAPASNLKDSTLKQKQMKTRIGMALLAAHKATVRGAPKPAPSRSRDPKEVQARLEARFAAMRKRMGDDSGSAE